MTELSARLASTDRKDLLQQHVAGLVDFLSPLLPNRPTTLSVAEMLEISGTQSGEVEQIYDLLIRTGQFGDGYGEVADGISLDVLKASPSGVNLGPMLAGRLPAALETPNRKIDLAPAALVQDLDRLEQSIAQGRFSADQFSLINRRHIRSNNSWLHNLHSLTKGPERHHAWLNPDDAKELGVVDGDWLQISSRVGEVKVQLQINDTVARRVVSVPHGWGQDYGNSKSKRSANVNQLTDDASPDRPSGNAAFNGVPVTVVASR